MQYMTYTMWGLVIKMGPPYQSHGTTCRLLSAARYLMKHCGVQVDLHHVKGHQDTRTCGPFTRDATLKIEPINKLGQNWSGTCLA